jgi:hypothetical protein
MRLRGSGDRGERRLDELLGPGLVAVQLERHDRGAAVGGHRARRDALDAGRALQASRHIGDRSPERGGVGGQRRTLDDDGLLRDAREGVGRGTGGAAGFADAGLLGRERRGPDRPAERRRSDDEREPGKDGGSAVPGAPAPGASGEAARL